MSTIRSLNDDFRRNLGLGVAVITPGIAALGKDAVQTIFLTVATFDDFTKANDPYSEHDFGCFDAFGEQIFFKIDYYDKQFNMHSPNPADGSVTERVITVMLAKEY